VRASQKAARVTPRPASGARSWLFRFFFGQQQLQLYPRYLDFRVGELFSIVLEILAVNERLHCTTIGTEAVTQPALAGGQCRVAAGRAIVRYPTLCLDSALQ